MALEHVRQADNPVFGRPNKKKNKSKSASTPSHGLKTGERSVNAEGSPVVVGPRTDGSLCGMRKWLAEYHSKRPGFDVIRQRTDEFIADFEEREEKARQEREAAAAEDDWTVIEHHKGRKKTTDVESGVTVGGVASAVVERKQKKQEKNGLVNFYRFQRREARRNEILELQQQFEDDKKKIAGLRAARKFRPY